MTRIEDIKARAEAATPGPWTDGERDQGYWVCQPGEDGDVVVGDHYKPDAPDAAFIAHARQDIPDLLRVAEAAAPFLRLANEMAATGKSNVVVNIQAIADALRPLLEDNQ
jgi:hypothetical protein